MVYNDQLIYNKIAVATIYIHYSAKERLISLEFKNFSESADENTVRVMRNLSCANIPYILKDDNIEIDICHFSDINDINQRVFSGFGRWDFIYRQGVDARKRLETLCVQIRTLDTRIMQAQGKEQISDLTRQRERLIDEQIQAGNTTENLINEHCVQIKLENNSITLSSI
ncbi:MAG: hypothetical protein CK424_07970 [Legionella sp.]|nr:MAG: hypothetical protein CK424_07970 [Legionella sp.]